MESESIIRLVRGNAEAAIGEKRFTVTRRDGGYLTDMCPADLIIAALGS